MNQFRHGLVIGKFYPPHSGHEFLIRSAAERCHHVSVIVMAATAESIPLERRVAWLRETFRQRPAVTVAGVVDDEPVDFNSEHAWRVHVEHMNRGLLLAEQSRAEQAGPVDAVFTSEDYGAELARRFSATSICIDRDRRQFPVSGTAVRNNPATYWTQLAPAVREYLCLRVVIVGAESTGKTTLCAALQSTLQERGGAFSGTQWVAEYGREYTQTKFSKALVERPAIRLEQLVWTSAEFEEIARVQQDRENIAARASGAVLICDTDAFATAIWHERYTGSHSDSVAAIAASVHARRAYILTDWREVPFEQDGLRDGEHLREWMHTRFVTELRQAGVPCCVIGGTTEQRVSRALAWIDAQLSVPTA
jgi:NadR type nicotinamide-nucleotide adenylyltransferase